ncbi:VCBS repeat-containing protein [Lunatibacter salilacus]|uniref:VCBS repeat-containing protein n=1 Tax=Lunatibacter salilacus TaxID=2483804 RepID=UPI00131E7C9C|nr:VCBS repeat-containing protein [Lunatibacter salilacus]
MAHKHILAILIIAFAMLSGCAKDHDGTLFRTLKSSATNLDFTNTITENDSVNILTYEYVYNGGGVGIGDFNNDGYPDVYLSGNMVGNRLYLNNKDLSFTDITTTVLECKANWSSGVAVVDINHDGWLDIYVCTSGPYDFYDKKNKLFVNQGLDADGIPQFIEMAEAYGLDFDGPTTHAAFFDYDKDGDLDLYLLNNTLKNNSSPNRIVPQVNDGSSVNNDRLFRNNERETGQLNFTDVSKEAGIIYEGYGLGLAVQDLNDDGWIDIYVSNDYISNDLVYINKGDGTFSEESSSVFGHLSYSAMGNDVADINNDGLVDIITVDMLPADNKGRKMMLPYVTYTHHQYQKLNGYHPQYTRNTLQLNNGVMKGGLPKFSEIGQLSGIAETDWSWGPLFVDFNNNGRRDLFISNGYPKDITNRDFSDFRQNTGVQLFKSYVEGNRNLLEQLDQYPDLKVQNKIFENNGDLTFTDRSLDWGSFEPSYSSGVAYADFDLDGDMDVLINNINQEVQLLENTLRTPESNLAEKSNYIKIDLIGPELNPNGLGAKVRLYCHGYLQFYENSPYRGYQSTVENLIHFGLGDASVVDSIEVQWPDGRHSSHKSIRINEVLKIHYSGSITKDFVSREIKALFKDVTKHSNIDYIHKEVPYVDFHNQILLPHMFSQKGPGIAVGDINGDNLEDFYVGGGFKHAGQFFVQNTDGTFYNKPITSGEKFEEDMGCLLFDADGDNDLDLYVVSGSSEFEMGSKYYMDRLYVNDGKGNFDIKSDALPDIRRSGANVSAADYDKDGDLDLFIGGMLVPNQYPMPASSLILRNETTSKDNPQFVDVTNEIAPELSRLGLVSSSLWTDFNNDGLLDLIVVGEWLPVTFFLNEGGTFKNITAELPGNVQEYTGWWNSIVGADFDNDGDIDYVVGNLGLNSKLKASFDNPLKLYADDFDKNGSIDPIIAYPLDGNYYPLASRDEIASQTPSMKKKFQNHTSFAEATFSDMFSEEELKNSVVLNAKYFRTAYFENIGNDANGLPKFEIKSLPTIAQFGPIYGMNAQDFDEDGNIDLLLTGNSFSVNPMLGRYDALNGIFLKGDGHGNFGVVPNQESGFFLEGDGKALAELVMDSGESLLLASQNNDSVKAFLQEENKFTIYNTESNDAYSYLYFKNGKKRKHEFYYGHSYLSQSTRKLKYDIHRIDSIQVYNFLGEKKTIIP